MKLATLKNNTRDGQLVVVSKDLQKAMAVPEIVHTMQQALDNWKVVSPQLNEIYQQLNLGRVDFFPFDCKEVMAPLPRAYQWADGSAYVNHVELVRLARGATLPDSFWHDPLMYQGGSDVLLGAGDDIAVNDEAYGIDFEAEIAIITDDVPMAVALLAAKSHIKLLMLVNDVSLRNLIPAELSKGFGFFQSKPASSFSPVAVTPDELGDAWDGCKLHLPLYSYLNKKLFGRPNAGKDMVFDFPMLIAHAAKTRKLSAGTIIGSGTVSNKDPNVGSSCIAEVRALETIEYGAPKTEFMKFGDDIKIEMFCLDGKNIFGSIEQRVVKYEI